MCAREKEREQTKQRSQRTRNKVRIENFDDWESFCLSSKQPKMLFQSDIE
jgi:hypothetical protein